MTDTTQAREQAQAQLDSIRAMVLRLQHATGEVHDTGAPCDLTDDCARCEGSGFTIPGDDCPDCEGAGYLWPATEYEGLSFENYHDEDDARDAINEDALSVEVRSGWQSPGEELTASEFAILLCTGGPAVRIRGELDEWGGPDRAWLEYQDWFTPWQHYTREQDMDSLLVYAREYLPS